MEKLKFTLLHLFDIAYRSRCSLPLLISTAYMAFGFTLSVDVQVDGHFQDHHVHQFLEEDDEEEDQAVLDLTPRRGGRGTRASSNA